MGPTIATEHSYHCVVTMLPVPAKPHTLYTLTPDLADSNAPTELCTELKADICSDSDLCSW